MASWFHFRLSLFGKWIPSQSISCFALQFCLIIPFKCSFCTFWCMKLHISLIWHHSQMVFLIYYCQQINKKKNRMKNINWKNKKIYLICRTNVMKSCGWKYCIRTTIFGSRLHKKAREWRDHIWNRLIVNLRAQTISWGPHYLNTRSDPFSCLIQVR